MVHRGQRGAAGRLADHFLDLPQVMIETPGQAADHAVGVAEADQHGADDGVVLTQALLGDIDGDAVPLHELMIICPAFLEALVAVRIDDFEVLADAQLRADFQQPRADHIGPTDQDRARQALFENDLSGAQNALVLAFRIDNARCRPLLGGSEHGAHADTGLVDKFLELFLVGGHVGDRPRGDAGIHRGLRHGGGDDGDQARIEGLGDQILGPE